MHRAGRQIRLRGEHLHRRHDRYGRQALLHHRTCESGTACELRHRSQHEGALPRCAERIAPSWSARTSSRQSTGTADGDAGTEFADLRCIRRLAGTFRSSTARRRRCRFAAGAASSKGCATEDGSRNDGERRKVGRRRLFRNIGRQSGKVDDHGSRKGRLGCRQRGENFVEMPFVVLLELLKQFVGIDGSQGPLSPPHGSQ